MTTRNRVCTASQCGASGAGTYAGAVLDQTAVALHERRAEPDSEAGLPVQKRLLALALALALIHVRHDVRDELVGVLDERVRLQRRVVALEGCREQERLEQEAVARDALHREEEVGLEADLRVRWLGTAFLRQSQCGQRAL